MSENITRGLMVGIIVFTLAMTGMALFYNDFSANYGIGNDNIYADNIWTNLTGQHLAQTGDSLNESVQLFYQDVTGTDDSDVSSENFEQRSFRRSIQGGQSSLFIMDNVRALLSAIVGVLGIPAFVYGAILTIILIFLTFAFLKFIRSGGGL